MVDACVHHDDVETTAGHVRVKNLFHSLPRTLPGEILFCCANHVLLRLQPRYD